jgi:large-conductance mechanosensitive channel
MDDTPGHFIQELRTSILRKRVGQIALAVVLAEACLRFLNALTWFLIVPLIGDLLDRHTESVLFVTPRPFPLQQLTGSVLDFGLAVIFVFYLNRWIHRQSASVEHSLQNPITPPEEGVENSTANSSETTEPLSNLVGDPVSPAMTK